MRLTRERESACMFCDDEGEVIVIEIVIEYNSDFNNFD